MSVFSSHDLPRAHFFASAKVRSCDTIIKRSSIMFNYPRCPLDIIQRILGCILNWSTFTTCFESLIISARTIKTWTNGLCRYQYKPSYVQPTATINSSVSTLFHFVDNFPVTSPKSSGWCYICEPQSTTDLPNWTNIKFDKGVNRWAVHDRLQHPHQQICVVWLLLNTIVAICHTISIWEL